MPRTLDIKNTEIIIGDSISSEIPSAYADVKNSNNNNNDNNKCQQIKIFQSKSIKKK